MRFLLLIALFLVTYPADASADTLQPWLGIGFSDTPRVRINEVIPDAPADIAGVQIGDVVLGVSGAPVKNGQGLIEAIARHQVGDLIVLRIRRGARHLEFSMELSDKLSASELLERRLVDRYAPRFALPRLQGTTSGVLPELVGQVVVLEFWSIQCELCKQSFSALMSFEAQYADLVSVLTISADAPTELQDFLQKTPIPLTVLSDRRGRIKSAYRAERDGPTLIVIGKDGRVRAAGTGADINIPELLIEAGRATLERPRL